MTSSALAAGDASRVYPTRGVHGRLVEQIGRRILGGELAPGAMLPREAELVQELGISRTAVREAIKVLAAKGLVESRQKLGMRVRPERAWNLLDPDVLAWQAASGPSPELTAHLVELRRMIEPAAARLAATRRSAEQLQALASALADMTAAVDDPLAYYRADLAFHRAVFAASGNPFVDRLGAIVSAVLEVSFRLQRRSLIPMAVGLAMHERVLAAVRARDADAAERAMDEIIEEARIELEQGDRSIGMKITKLETIRLLEFPNILWVRVHGEDGLYGLGETFMAAASVEAFLHEIVAPRILGVDAHAIDLIAAKLYGYLGFRSSGVETRAASAVDIALWDLWGKATNQPVVQLLGGRTRERIRTYNTCAGYQYIRDTRLQQVENWGLGNNAGPYEDLEGFLHRADEVALSLLEQGITGMKIWPFDPAAEASGGHYISGPDLDRALEPFRKIRERRRQQDGHHGRVPLDVEPADRDPHRPRAGAVRHVLARGPDQDGRAGGPRDLCRRQPRPGLRLGDAGLPPVLPRAAGSAGRRHRHARPVLVRRPLRGQEDRHHGRGLPPAGRTARLHRPGGPGGLHPPLLQRAQRPDPGIGARLLHRLVPGAGHRPARGEGRHDRAAARAGPRAGPAARLDGAQGRGGAQQRRGLMLKLASQQLRLAVRPAIGGAVAQFDWLGGAEPVPLFRAWDGHSDDPNRHGCYPLVPWSNRISGGGIEAGGSVLAAPAELAGGALPDPRRRLATALAGRGAHRREAAPDAGQPRRSRHSTIGLSSPTRSPAQR